MVSEFFFPFLICVQTTFSSPHNTAGQFYEWIWWVEGWRMVKMKKKTGKCNKNKNQHDEHHNWIILWKQPDSVPIRQLTTRRLNMRAKVELMEMESTRNENECDWMRGWKKRENGNFLLWGLFNVIHLNIMHHPVVVSYFKLDQNTEQKYLQDDWIFFHLFAFL